MKNKIFIVHVQRKKNQLKFDIKRQTGRYDDKKKKKVNKCKKKMREKKIPHCQVYAILRLAFKLALLQTTPFWNIYFDPFNLPVGCSSSRLFRLFLKILYPNFVLNIKKKIYSKHQNYIDINEYHIKSVEKLKLLYSSNKID